MGRTVVRTTVVSLAALVLGLVPGVGGGIGGAGDVARASAIPGICTAVVHSWAGRATVGPGESFHTGTTVQAQTGVQLAVEASDVSTDVPAPGELTLWIGDTPVADGAAVIGGEIAVTNIGAGPVVVTRVEISIDECVQVEVAPPLPPAPGVPAAPIDLPATGTPTSTSIPLTVAVLATAVGAALLLVRRRPPLTGSGRGR